jgi:hypothetical protein
MGRPEDSWFGWMHGKQFRLTRDYSKTRSDPQWKGYRTGTLVKVVMVSRMGDVGVTTNLQAENGYGLRMMPYELEPIEPRPDIVCKLCNLELGSGNHEGGHLDRKCNICGGSTSPCDAICNACYFTGRWKE